MNDQDLANQKIWGGGWKHPEPPIEQQFTEIARCLECGGEVWQEFSGDEGWGICNTCGEIEGDTETIYQCSLCLEESEDQECNCYK